MSSSNHFKSSLSNKSSGYINFKLLKIFRCFIYSLYSFQTFLKHVKLSKGYTS